MPLQATSGAASYDAFGGGVVAEPNYIESCFSTYLYTGTGAALTITNNIDLSTKGGLVWVKQRNNADPSHFLADTARGIGVSGNSKRLCTNTTGAEESFSQNITSISSTGFTVGNDIYNGVNSSGGTHVSWTFRKQPKFFDVVTYTGNGTARSIAHSLGSAPGCVIIKSTSGTGSWAVWHRSGTQENRYSAFLNFTDAYSNQGSSYWGTPLTDAPNMNATTFSVGTVADVNSNGATYVAYLFAHNAGGFGLTGTDNVISCGSYTGNGSSSGPTITLGYEPQWLLIKGATGASSWLLVDNMRGWDMSSADAVLQPNVSDAEYAAFDYGNPTSTGFQINGTSSDRNASGQTYIYIAIRRGPMKVPTVGTSVFLPQTRTGTGSGTVTVSNIGFTPDLAIIQDRGSNQNVFEDRLRGNFALFSSQTNAESDTGVEGVSGQQGWAFNASLGYGNGNANYVNYYMGRAPGYFDEVCYTGTGTSSRNNSHNLAAVPELMIVKERNFAGTNWRVYSSTLGNTKEVYLNQTNASTTTTSWASTTPTASVFTVGVSGGAGPNDSGSTYVAYLFATCAGVSKVGSYTGNGTTQTINCGFTGGARLVLIKRTNSTGDWYVYDTARGMTVLTDPYLLFNTNDGEVATLGSVTTVSTGFALNSTILAAINVNGGSYIFLAIS